MDELFSKLKNGTRIVLKKKKDKKSSVFPSGKSADCIITADATKDQPLHIKAWFGNGQTGKIISLKENKKKIILETPESVYQITFS